MGCMFRSELMSQCDIYLQPESAYDIISELGEVGLVQFNDMNPELSAFQRAHVMEVMRCAEMERKLRYMEKELKKDNIAVHEPSVFARAPGIGDMVYYEGITEMWEEELREITTNQTNLKKNFLELSEMYYVLTHIGPIVGDTDVGPETLTRSNRELGERGRLFILTGVVHRSKCYAFEIMLWRMSHGNIYYRQAHSDETLEDPITGQGVRKVAFLAACQGEQLGSHLQKVCSGFRANLYNCPFAMEEREDMVDKLADRLMDLQEVMAKTKLQRDKTLRTISRQWLIWKVAVRKMKAIYHTMNLFNVDLAKKCLIGRCWVPTSDLPMIRSILEKCSDKSMSQLTSFLSKVETNEEPPTFNRTNKFTKGFQVLINAYGVSTYREVNPALYTIITFPFLFSVMFGDVGHALIMVVFASWMVIYERALEDSSTKNEVWGIFFGGRYIVLLLGLFSLYTGFIYNDLFSRSINILGSHWQNVYDNDTLSLHKTLVLDPRVATTDSLYFLGVDPCWNLAKNKILFENSLKMKFSIIIGVTHMMFGVCMGVVNYNYFRHRYSIILEFLPQILFLTLIFFYLVFMIFYKWFKYSGEYYDIKLHAGCAPLVLILFIDMMLLSTSKSVDPACDAYMFDHQKIIQRVLVLGALCCIPIILLGKPLYLHAQHKKMKKYLVANKSTQFRSWMQKSTDKPTPQPVTPVDDYCFSDVMIHQAVHTIEYVLSTISHTASYLRLWALSLAHSQLSEMLWIMILSKNGLRTYTILGAFKLYVSFAIWAAFTLSILVLMEGLSAFLHTLRLHWVEFMSKFYMGTGYPFCPFSFKTILSMDDKDDKFSSSKRAKK